MHVERGPQGKILVFEVLAGTEIVVHAYDSLRSFPLSNVLPVYLREVFGEKQLCVDCTELVPLADLRDPLEHCDLLRKNFLSFLISIFRAEDRFISRDFLVADPRYVFLNKSEASFFWCCFPVTPTAGNLHPIEQSFADRLKLLLSCELVSSLFDESLRDTIWTDVISEHEDGLITQIHQQKEEKPEEATKGTSEKRSTILFIQFVLMLFFLAFIFLWNDLSLFSLETYIWAPPFVLVSGMALLFTLLFSAKEYGKQSQTRKKKMSKEEEKTMAAVGIKSHDTQDVNPFFSYPRAFLSRLSSDRDSSDKNTKRFPLLVNDFLVGKDSILCDLVLDDKSISDRHARILKREGSYFLMDVGSSAGSMLGDRILYSYEEYPLSDNDIFSLGDIHLQFHQYT